MRFPTDATPPNQRRLAENDALVELIQTHLCGDREITSSTPLGMVIPSIEEEEEVEEDENGSTKGPQRDQMEDWEEDLPMEMEERLEER